jgi:hypothetical protein
VIFDHTPQVSQIATAASCCGKQLRQVISGYDEWRKPNYDHFEMRDPRTGANLSRGIRIIGRDLKADSAFCCCDHCAEPITV